MTNQRESALERKVVHDAAKKYGVFSTKMGTSVSTGYPDRLFFLPNARVLMIEFKTLRGKVSPKQEYIHEVLREAGHTVVVCREYEDAMGQIRVALCGAAKSV